MDQYGGDLKLYNQILKKVKAEMGYTPGQGAAGKALLAECRREASRRHAAEKPYGKATLVNNAAMNDFRYSLGMAPRPRSPRVRVSQVGGLW